MSIYSLPFRNVVFYVTFNKVFNDLFDDNSTNNLILKNIFSSAILPPFVALFGSSYSRMDQMKLVSLGRTYHFKFFKGCLPQTLIGPVFNTLTHF